MTKPTANDIDRQLGLRLKKARQLAGLSAAALAEATGSTQQQLSRYENGQNKISAAQLYLLANHLGMPVSWFFLEMDIPSAAIQTGNEQDGNELRESAPPSYIVSKLAEEDLAKIYLLDDTATLDALWPRIPPNQRNALLRLMDTMIE